MDQRNARVRLHLHLWPHWLSLPICLNISTQFDQGHPATLTIKAGLIMINNLGFASLLIHQLRWSAIDSELWLIHMASNLKTNSPTASHKCNNYNCKGYCSWQSCFYSHKCMYWFDSQTQVQCPRQKREAHSNALPA